MDLRRNINHEYQCDDRDFDLLDGLDQLSLAGASYGLLLDCAWPETLNLVANNDLDYASPVFSAKRGDGVYSIRTHLHVPAPSLPVESVIQASYELSLAGPLDRLISFNGLSRVYRSKRHGGTVDPDIVLRSSNRQILPALTRSIRILRNVPETYKSM